MSLPLFLPTLEGLSPVVGAHLEAASGAALVRRAVEGSLLARLSSTYLACMGPVPPRRRPEYLLSIRLKLPRAYETALAVPVCWHRPWAGGQGRTNWLGMEPGQLPRAGLCCHRRPVEWHGKEWPYSTALEATLGLPGKARCWEGAKLEGLGGRPD